MADPKEATEGIYMQLITDCEDRDSKLTEWERTFLDSIKNQLEMRGFLTSRQTDNLAKIWKKATKNG